MTLKKTTPEGDDADDTGPLNDEDPAAPVAGVRDMYGLVESICNQREFNLGPNDGQSAFGRRFARSHCERDGNAN